MPLHVIKGTPPPDTPAEKVRKRVAAHPKPVDMLQCGCGGREVIEARVGMIFKNGRASGGTKQYLCAGCLMRGRRVVLA